MKPAGQDLANPTLAAEKNREDGAREFRDPSAIKGLFYGLVPVCRKEFLHVTRDPGTLFFALLIPMLLHFLNNGLAVIVMRIAALQRLDEPGPDDPGPPWHLFVTAGVLVAATLVALYQSRARLGAPPGEPAWQPSSPGVALPPPESSTRVWSPWPSIEASAGVVAALALFGLSLVGALHGY